MKPMKACNWDEKKVRFPVYAQPKLDGVRGLTTEKQLTGRSLKTFANRYTQARFSTADYAYLDGELVLGSAVDSALCRNTTSALTSIHGSPDIKMHAFDILTPEYRRLPYASRYTALCRHVKYLHSMGLAEHVTTITNHVVTSMEQLLMLDKAFLDLGYEGTILRDPNGMHKEGRSTIREGGLLRIKRFADAEAIVVAIVEGEHNMNEQQTNELGNSFRTSHQENKVPNGMVGSLTCKDIVTGQIITVAPGVMTHEERAHFFEHQYKLLGQTIKYQHFPKGVKDKPRFPTYQGIRSLTDMD